MQGDVFGLDRVYEKQVENITSVIETIAVYERLYGYFGGGSSGGTNFSTIDRLDFSTESIASPVIPAKLSTVRRQLAAVSSANYGYFGGGDTSGPGGTYVSTIDRLDFSTETIASPVIPAKLSQARYGLAAVSSSSYGYFGGGGDTPTTRVSTIDRLDFSTETIASPVIPAKLSTGRDSLAATSSSSYGYFAGGDTSPTVETCTIDRLDFSTETIATPGSYQLSQAKEFMRATSSSSYGYFGGGYVTTGAVVFSTIDRLDFSTEIIASPVIPAKLSIARRSVGAVSSSSYGYFGGGGVPPAPTPTVYSIIDRLDFSTDTVSTPAPKLSQARNIGATVQVNRNEVIKKSPLYTNWPESATTGYFGGGYIIGPGISQSTIDRLDFSTETVSVPGPKLSQVRGRLATVSSSSYGYFGGGGSPIVSQSTIDRLDFSTDTVSAPGTYQLSQARQTLAATSNNSYGYFAGGLVLPATRVCTIDRLDFSTETRSVPTPKLSQARDGLAAVSSSSYGYFGGGLRTDPGIDVCTIDRLDFSTETVSVPTPKLSQGRQDLTATSSSSYGYFAGGFTPTGVCTIDRLDFSTETVSVPTPKLSDGRGGLAAASSSSYGYFGGGSSPTMVCTIDRLDFSTETVSVPTPKLSQARTDLAATSGGIGTRRVGSATYGYFAGGNTGSGTSNLDRFDFSIEGLSNLSSDLSVARWILSATTSSYYGYIAGGGDAGGFYSTIDRLDFSSETRATPGTYQLSLSKWRMGSTASSSYGYFGGGFSPAAPAPGVISTIDRLDFSTETRTTPSPKLSQAREGAAATSSNSYGYFGGGNLPPAVCTIDRLDFSTETVLAPGTYQLSAARQTLATVSSSSYGYFGGGDSSTIDRLDFSTETRTTPTPKLSSVRSTLAAFSNSSYGYFGGGTTSGPTIVSTIDRLDFSTEVLTTPITKLSEAKWGLTGFSNAN